jgi:glutaminyl-peptide cyclotransferase
MTQCGAGVLARENKRSPGTVAPESSRTALLRILTCTLAPLLVLTCPCRSYAQTSSTPSQFALVHKPHHQASNASPVATPTIDPQRAFRYIKDIVAFGPRPIGSANHRKVEQYILAHLKGDHVESDTFTADTPEGKFPIHNIIAKYPGSKDGIIVIAGHYDTNYPLRNTAYVGANDGGSSAAILLELANQLRGKRHDGWSVWLVWTDGEEAVRQWSPTDSLYGTRHLAEKWQSDGTLKKIKAFLLADMIGDANLNIERDTNSTPWLEDLLYQAASALGYQSHFFVRTTAIEDDHLPFVQRGVPSADVIDLDYGYGNVFHHTTQDTIDKLSPKSLEITGNVILQTIWMMDKR